MTKKVIIIDDSITQLNIIKTAFAKDKWEVFGAQNAKLGLKLIYNTAPDLIVTDAMMPVMGGFQLLSIIRKDETINKIPIIVYSIMEEKNAKFYLREDLGEYYLKKNNELDSLLRLAIMASGKHPVSEEYKLEILKKSIDNDFKEEKTNQNVSFKSYTYQQDKKEIDFNSLEVKLKEKYNFSISDETILHAVFDILYPIFKYNLFVVSLYSFEKQEKVVYFDIKDIILSPILQDKILETLNAKTSFLFKKYIPNLTIIVQEEEFKEKIRFDFEYNDKITATIIIYCLEKQNYKINDIDKLKDLLNDFFKARYINKCAKKIKNNEFANKYFLDKFDFKFNSFEKKNIYTAIIEINNLKDLQLNLNQEELDIINSRITQKIVSTLNEDEQVYKNSDDEYVIIFFAKDVNNAHQKLECVINILDEIEYDTFKINSTIGAMNCKIDGEFNFHEAQKIALSALDMTNSQNRIVIYDSKQSGS